MRERDIAFGKLAIARGLASREAVSECFRAIEPTKATLRDELVRRGLLGKAQANELESLLGGPEPGELTMPFPPPKTPAITDTWRSLPQAPPASPDPFVSPGELTVPIPAPPPGSWRAPSPAQPSSAPPSATSWRPQSAPPPSPPSPPPPAWRPTPVPPPAPSTGSWKPSPAPPPAPSPAWAPQTPQVSSGSWKPGQPLAPPPPVPGSGSWRPQAPTPFPPQQAPGSTPHALSSSNPDARRILPPQQGPGSTPRALSSSNPDARRILPPPAPALESWPLDPPGEATTALPPPPASEKIAPRSPLGDGETTQRMPPPSARQPMMTASALARGAGTSPALPIPPSGTASSIPVPRVSQSGIREVLPSVGEVVDRYRILAALSKDASCAAFHAKHEMLEIEVALKVMMIDGDEADRFNERLRRGLLALERVDRRAGIARIRANGFVGARRFPYAAIDLARGTTLASVLKGGPLPPLRAFDLCERVARSLHACHVVGLTHRSLSPSCIVLRDQGGEPLVTDICLTRDEARERLARTFEVEGAAYLAPELVRGRAQEQDVSVDVYAIGAILHECLTGEPPFKSDSPALLVNKVLTEDPPDPSKVAKGVPPDAGAVTRKCLAKTKEQRYASALELADELARLRTGQPVEARSAGFQDWKKKGPRGR